ncbi:2-phosphosulfolactate phosphatase [Piscibacillus halophilus]|uniref:Probable 2-phosphosulfolactate phosphatase n=1 Tax=Piscibacillus halophilus TaxID=571933 RepID=A0A1H9HI19_9BACI|nr:2-phosphosulfolactate phosphatase [Piscibacillus halophilus]SEQ61954.1 2-phosphosulfolactate phosphatase [Piscibacillus halophilus]
MSKIHLLLKKEEIDETKINDQQIMVVFDVLLATTTIISALKDGAKEVIPVKDHVEAKREAYGLDHDEYILSGEYAGATLEGFQSPNPLTLRDVVNNKTLILSTTNGTVAIKKSVKANRVYIASLLNGEAVSGRIVDEHLNQSIVLVCAGSGGQFNIEDFYGAGYLIDLLLEKASFDLSDAALAAYKFYVSSKNEPQKILKQSAVGQMLCRNQLEDVIDYVALKSNLDLVPYLIDGKKIVVESNKQVYLEDFDGVQN